MGQLSHLSVHGSVVLKCDPGAAWGSIWPQVTLAAIYCKLLDEPFFNFIKVTLINRDSLFIQLAPSSSSAYDLGYSGFLYWLLFLVLIILSWWTID